MRVPRCSRCSVSVVTHKVDNTRCETTISETNFETPRRRVLHHRREIACAVSYVVYFETAFSSARAWSIWSYA